MTSPLGGGESRGTYLLSEVACAIHLETCITVNLKLIIVMNKKMPGPQRSVSFDKSGMCGLAGNVLTFVTFRKILHSLSLERIPGKEKGSLWGHKNESPLRALAFDAVQNHSDPNTLTPSDADVFHPARENISPSMPAGFPAFVQSMLEAECLVSNQAPVGTVSYPTYGFNFEAFHSIVL